jgi:signal transduction histidine kinase
MAGPLAHYPPRPTYHLSTAYTPPRQFSYLPPCAAANGPDLSNGLILSCDPCPVPTPQLPDPRPSSALDRVRNSIRATVLLLLILAGIWPYAQAQPGGHSPDTAHLNRLHSDSPQPNRPGQDTAHIGQPTPDIPAIDLAATGILDNISNICFVYFSPEKNISPDSLPFLPFPREAGKFNHYILPPRVNSTPVIRFTLFNSSDRVQNVFLCPGFYFDRIQIFELRGSSVSGGSAVIRELPAVMPNERDSLGYRKISLPPYGRSTYFVKLSSIRAPTNTINPSLTQEVFIRKGITLNHRDKTDIDIMTNLFAGIMLMMIFYALSEFMQTTKAEFPYYAVYAICISSLLFLKSILHDTTTRFSYFFEGYLDNIIFCAGHISYIIFHRKFLDTKKNYPDLDRYLYWGFNSVIVLMLLYSIAFFWVPDFRVVNYIEDSTKYVLLLIIIIFIWKGLHYKDELMNYIVFGNISLCVLSLLSQLMIATNWKIVKGQSIINLSLFYYELGIIIEVLFFLFAVTYKNKKEIVLSIQKEEKLKLETERKELEKQVAVLAAKQDERNRISADMHDELGSGVTAIRLMSEIVKSKMKEQTLPEIEKISHSANELLNKMNTIIWTMTSSNDSVENLVAYIRSYAVEFFESTTIDCHFNMPADIVHREISGEKRRNIFLCVKESLNNVLKHSQGSYVKINVLVSDRLIIEILDDGVGINMEKLRKFGNGLNNMKKRMVSIEGEFAIEAQGGTRTTFNLPL